jgi:starch synthase
LPLHGSGFVAAGSFLTRFMRILLASSEVHPYSKTGGLADMVGALGKALARAGHRVGIVTPLYLGTRERFPELNQLLDLPLDLPLGLRRVRAEVWSAEPMPGLTVYFIDQPEYYQRSTLYHKDGLDYPDNAERFIFFSKAVARLALRLPWKPELLHAHDWQAGLAVALLEHQRRAPGQGTVPRTCMTIHNLAYQGVFPVAQYALTNLPWDYFTPSGLEFYGQMNCLKAGIAYADVLTTVSPRYAREITTQDLGCGLDGLLRQRQASLIGILNGVDYDEWNTTDNPYLKHSYGSNDLAGKAANKADLQREVGLPVDPKIPLFGNIGRMVEHKGGEIMLGTFEEMLRANIQFVQLGTGEPVFQRAFQDLARRFPDRAVVQIGYDEGLSHRIEAGCDFFVMPSRFEPCGLNQMYSLRYATIPIVRATGGLDDTVIDIKEDAARANGIKFNEYSSRAFAKGIQKALALYHEPELLQHFRQNAMAADFSWDRTAGEFVRVYQRAVRPA